MRSGGAPCHQATTGASGASRGNVTDSACSARRPCIRMTTASPGPSRPPIRTSASSRGTGASICRRITINMRMGCLLAASVAASSASCTSRSSTTTTSVNALPLVTAPPVRRSAARALTTAVPVVSHSVVTRSHSSRSTPFAAVTGQHLVCFLWSPLTCAVQVGGLAGPEFLERVDHLPRGLDLLIAGEQRRVSDEHVEDQPFVGLRRGLGEGLAVQEVHRDVADLHRAARHLGTELERHTLVRLDSNDQLVVAQLLGVGAAEGEVRGPLEQDPDLGNAAGKALSRPHIEGHAGPSARLHTKPNRGVRLGLRVRRDAVLIAVGLGSLTREPTLVVLTADGTGVEIGRQADGPEHFDLLGTDLLRGELDRFLLRGERETLEQVVLQDVPRRSSGVV